jgi:plastocyanin
MAAGGREARVRGTKGVAVKRTVVSIAAVALGLVLVVPAGATPRNVSVTIRHQVRGCHAWAIGTGAYKPSQTLKLTAGSAVTFTNNDVMPHKLFQLAGPAVAVKNLKAPAYHMGMGLRGPFAPGTMARMGASTRVTFAHPGVYSFITKPGEDYMQGMKTIGEDNVLRLKVIVR